MNICTWVNAEYSNKKNFNGWNPYVTSLCKGETHEEAICRIKSDNPNLDFRNFRFTEEAI